MPQKTNLQLRLKSLILFESIQNSLQQKSSDHSSQTVIKHQFQHSLKRLTGALRSRCDSKWKCRRGQEQWGKKSYRDMRDTHQRAAASRIHCTLTHETNTSDPKYTPLPPPLSFLPQIQIYTPLMALGAPGGMDLTLWRTPAVELRSNTATKTC